MDTSNKINVISLDAYVRQTRHTSRNADPAPSDRSQTHESVQTDRVELSSTARLIQQAGEMAQKAPDIREELVARIREKIEKGTYRVDAEKAAGALMDEALTNSAHLSRP